MIFFNKKRPVFILGCQRSGTTIGVKNFRESNQFDVYGEGSKAAMKKLVRLRSSDKIQGIIKRSRKQFVVFKPLNDSHRADQLLEQFDNSCVIWFYRDVFDVVNSAVVKWGDLQQKMIAFIAGNLRKHGSIESAMPDILEEPRAAIYAERLGPEMIECLLKWTEGEISAETGAAVIWYLRNSLFFELNLDADDRALLVKYENFATNPAPELQRICKFLNAPYTEALSTKIHSSSIGKSGAPPIAHDVLDACEQLTDRFSAALKEVN